jgi:hypothetical protein
MKRGVAPFRNPQSAIRIRHAPLSRREWLRSMLGSAVLCTLPAPLAGCGGARPSWALEPDLQAMPPTEEDLRRLAAWVEAVRAAGLHHQTRPLGSAAAVVGERALGTPYEAFTLEEYLHAGGSPMRTEPLTLSLSRFDCVTLVESCIALARLARAPGAPTWEGFGREMERLRYRGGERGGYLSRLHYFSEWILDNQHRGALRDLGPQLGGVADTRPLRFMTSNRQSYPALADPQAFAAMHDYERRLDGQPRWVVPTERIPAVVDSIHTGDVLAFATSIEGLDVTHSAFAYRHRDGVLRVLHAPLTGGVVEITGATLQEYVRGIRRSTGVLVARLLA